MRFSTLSLVAFISLAIAAPTTPSHGIAKGIKVSNPNIAAADLVPGSYFIVYEDSASDENIKKHHSHIKTTIGKGSRSFNLPGFKAIHVQTNSTIISSLGKNPIVSHIELDSKVSLNPIISSTNATTAPFKSITSRSLLNQGQGTWGLGRISHKLPGSKNYIFDSSSCTNTTTYVVDTGIRTTHTEFQGRALWGANFVSGAPNTDDHGHGTHVAGTIGGINAGVCKKTTLIAVKVLNSSGVGSVSDILAGVQWAYADAVTKSQVSKSVINLSVGGSFSTASNSLITSIVNSGLSVVVAAGNNNDLAANYSPASATGAITVGATNSTDARAAFSNFGSAVDIFAPGVGVLSAFNTCDSCYYYYDGTSQAAPHVAGLAAYLIAKDGVATPKALVGRINALAIANRVVDAGTGSPNSIAYNGNGY